jgi:hypothetical protein
MKSILSNNESTNLSKLDESLRSFGEDRNGKLTPEFKEAIETWDDIAQTKEGQIELIEAAQNKERSAILYILYRSSRKMFIQLKDSISSFKRGIYNKEDLEDEFESFKAEIYILFTSEKEDGTKSPIDTFNPKLIKNPEVTPLGALMHRLGQYAAAHAQGINNDYNNFGITGYGSKSVGVIRDRFDDENHSSEGSSKPTLVKTGDDTYTFSSKGGTAMSGVGRQRPTEDTALLSSTSKEALRVWKEFCSDPALYKDKGITMATVLKDYFLGEKVRNKEYADKNGCSTGTAKGRYDQACALLKSYFNLDTKSGVDEDDLLKLMREYTPEKLVKYLRK